MPEAPAYAPARCGPSWPQRDASPPARASRAATFTSFRTGQQPPHGTHVPQLGQGRLRPHYREPEVKRSKKPPDPKGMGATAGGAQDQPGPDTGAGRAALHRRGAPRDYQSAAPRPTAELDCPQIYSPRFEKPGTRKNGANWCELLWHGIRANATFDRFEFHEARPYALNV